MTRTGRILSWLAYPSVLAGAMSAFAALQAGGLSAGLAAYGAVFGAALCILYHERWLPYRAAWRPGRHEVLADLGFLLLVQMLLPKLLGWSLVLAAEVALAEVGAGPSGLWPHHWPLAGQALLMLLLADLLRYWLHRACHDVPLLWRLHAVHHRPDKLYTLNVARFHPLEKALQFGLDAAPFLVLGVGSEVLAIYFVFYAVNGFYQHSNCALRLGWLNRVIAGPELHRWHHVAAARRPVLQLRQQPDRLGSTVRHPLPAVGPSGAGGRPRSLAMTMLETQAANFALKVAMQATGAFAWRPLLRAAKRPQAVQEDLLRRILDRQAETDFGRRHGFARLRSWRDYRSAVPVQSYEDLRPLIERQERTGRPCLTLDRPISYARTSGTTGQPKYLPLTAAGLRRFARGQRLFAYSQHRQADLFAGKVLGLGGAAEEGRLPTGTPYGAAGGMIHRAMPSLVRSKCVLPGMVMEIADYDLRAYGIARLALAQPDVTALVTANPSTLVRLLAVINDRADDLLADLARGGLAGGDGLPPEQLAALLPHLTSAPDRARHLRGVLRAQGRFTFANLWPGLRAVVTWTGGSCGLALAELRPDLPGDCRSLEMGYVASELRGSLLLDGRSGACLPTLRDVAFEFVERDHWEEGREAFVGLEALEPGRQYYLFATTADGLYRYDMNDIVRCTGRFRESPTIAFVQKGQGVTSITGEKLHEDQLLHAVAAHGSGLGLHIPFFVALADEQAGRYRLYLETAHDRPLPAGFAEVVDGTLRTLNMEYDAKRASGRLALLSCRRVRRGTGEAYRRFCVTGGQRDSQYKLQPLQYRRRCGFDFERHAVGEAAA